MPKEKTRCFQRVLLIAMSNTIRYMFTWFYREHYSVQYQLV